MADAPSEERNPRERRNGWLCLLAVLLVWIGFQLAGRLGARQALTPWDVTALRLAGGFLAILPIVLWRGPPLLPPARALAIVATAGLGFPLGTYVGLSLAPVSHAAVILFGALPIAATVLGWSLMGDPAPPARLASLPTIATGIGLIAADGRAAAPGAWRGDLCFAAAVTCLAAFTLLIRRWGIPALKSTATLCLYSAPLYLPVWLLLLPSTLGAASPAAILTQLAVQGVATALVATFLYSRAVIALGPGPPTLVAALVPGLTSLASWWLLGESLGRLGWLGIGLATLGMGIGMLKVGRIAPRRAVAGRPVPR